MIATAARTELSVESYIFSATPGNVTPLAPRSLNQHFRRVLARVTGAPRDLTVYSVRHFHVTHLIAHGVDLRSVSTRAGHSRSSITADTYAHYIPGTEMPSVQALVDALK
jgi:site-specific recombinase XerD